ncbi:hypothetical protein ABW21_db0204047 [Orbilia brochopaga]|nr:hypothetical protein ABW21_db0204047 [Drechslerella brochopaga]
MPCSILPRVPPTTPVYQILFLTPSRGSGSSKQQRPWVDVVGVAFEEEAWKGRRVYIVVWAFVSGQQRRSGLAEAQRVRLRPRDGRLGKDASWKRNGRAYSIEDCRQAADGFEQAAEGQATGDSSGMAGEELQATRFEDAGRLRLWAWREFSSMEVDDDLLQRRLLRSGGLLSLDLLGQKRAETPRHTALGSSATALAPIRPPAFNNFIQDSHDAAFTSTASD